MSDVLRTRHPVDGGPPATGQADILPAAGDGPAAPPCLVNRGVARIGLAYPAPDPTSPDNWSGTPRGLFDGFRSHGVEVVPVACALPPVARHGIGALYRTARRRGRVAHVSRVQVSARTGALARALQRAGRLDALLAMGTDMYDLDRVVGDTIPVATYDDGTFAQFLRYPESDVRRHGYPRQQVNELIRLQMTACRRADLCFASTGWAARSIAEDYEVSPDRVTVVGMGHRPRHVAADLKDWSRASFLFVGVDWGRKNGAAVLDAFRRLRADHPTATLDVVGEHPPITDEGVTGHGMLRRQDPGAQRLLDDLFSRCTAFVLPSRFDPSPIAYLEAASAGMPVIATTEGGAGELLGPAALTVHPDDGAGLLAAMRTLADAAIARALGAAAAERAEDSTWQAVSGRMLQALGERLRSGGIT